MAKAIAGGFPLSAIGARGEVMSTTRAGDHGSTFVGNPVSCGAALAGIDAMEAEDLPAHVRMLGARLSELAMRHPHMRVRGLGPMIGVEVVAESDGAPHPVLAEALVRRARDEGVLLIRSGPEANVIRILPPLVITDDDLGLALDAIESSADAVLEPSG